MPTPTLTHIDLFSGIGGFALAARWAGLETVQFVEIDPFCQKVLKKHWPEVPIHDDIKTLTYGAKICRECVPNVEKEKSRQIDHIANHVIQKELSLGEIKTEKNEGQQNERGASVKEMRCSIITEGNVSVVENQHQNFSPSTTSIITETQKENNLTVKHGKSPLSVGFPMITKSFATTATMPKPTMEFAHTNEVKNEHVFLLTAGVPCQPASCAGKRRGTNDDRWLWEEAIRVLAEVKPTWAIFENVAGLFSLESGVVFDNLLSQMEAEGYEVQAFIIPACAKNAPHRRDRVWIIGKSNGTGTGEQSGNIYRWSESQTIRKVKLWDVPDPTDCHAPDTGNTGLQGGEWRGPFQEGRALTHGTITECGGNSQWTENWLEAAQRFCQLDARISNRLDGCLTLPETYGIMGFILMLRRFHYATSKETRTREILRVLQEAFGEESVQRCFGRLSAIFEAEDLWCPVHGENDGERKENEVCLPEGSSEISGEIVREMRSNDNSINSSQRRGLEKQCTCEFDDIVFELSSEIALGEWKRNSQKAENILFDLWKESGGKRFLHEPLSALYEIWRSVTDKEIGAFRRHYSKRNEHRVQKLKALGNAIVPQIAYKIIKAILEVENAISD